MIRKGKQLGRQRFQCKDCNKNFQNKSRKGKLRSKLWEQYVWGKQTVKQLADKYHHSIKWIRQELDQAEVSTQVLHPQPVVGIADCTFWGRGYGAIIFRSQALKQNLYWREIATETSLVYGQGRRRLEATGFTLQAIVVDGKGGVKGVFADIPIQHCQFHQMQTITHYLTTKPKLEASQELQSISLELTRLDEETLTKLLADWHEKWKYFLKERTINSETGKWFYTHKRTRSAYRSLKTNLPYLFTYQKYPELNIPNTTNSLDGSFNNLKKLVGIHSGLRKQRRWRVIQEVLTNPKH